jgi:Fe-S-cluster containining protein
VRIRIDGEQRFTCSQCGMCCRRGWDIAVTSAEVESYRRAHAERWFREEDGAPADPFEAIGGMPGRYRIAKRADGSCGFLSAQNRCRIHEEMGGASKPLSCRLFPFRVGSAGGETVVASSFCCPTIVRNEGAPLAERELKALAGEWLRDGAATAGLELVRGRAIGTDVAQAVRAAFRSVLERRRADGGLDLAENLARLARLADDLGRRRVLKLADERLAEYVTVVGGHAARDAAPARRQEAGAVARLLSRGFLFAALAALEQAKDPQRSGLRLGLRLRLLRLLGHVHGLGPGVGGVDVRLLPRVKIDMTDPDLHAIVYNYLRSTIEALGSGPRPMLEELSLAVAVLEAAFALGAMRAGRAGRDRLEAEDLVDGLTQAAELTHASDAGAFAAVLSTLYTGSDSLWRLAARATVSSIEPE